MKDSNTNKTLSKDKVLLAQIVATKGLIGELKLKSFTENPLSLLEFEIFTDTNLSLKILSGYVQGNLVIVKIKGIDTIEQAKNLVGLQLFTNRENLPKEAEEEFYYVDLIGLSVLDSHGEKIGKVAAVNNYGAGDFLEIKKLDGTIETIMFTKENVPTVAIEEGYIAINKINYIDLEENNS
ncbi:MAG: ribosome maturation factor RimM [Alphaproteobacteria bacterium]|nr:ribosome maturation factor RimM [Alphaproteobacteria bacterium]